MEFKPMPKTPRLSREVVITEKIDGTNASVLIFPRPCEGMPESAVSLAEWEGAKGKAVAVLSDVPTLILAGSRTRWITPKDDNYGFAAWVRDNVEELAKLGPGHHFGEWWGKGIQRGYGLTDRRWSLFNVGRWIEHASDALSHARVGDTFEIAPECCHVVPVLQTSNKLLDTAGIDGTLAWLQACGSRAAPGFMDPEGIMVYHTAANMLFKKTVKGDEEGKHAEAHPPKVREPQKPRAKDPSKGGRRKEQVPFTFADRRIHIKLGDIS